MLSIDEVLVTVVVSDVVTDLVVVFVVVSVVVDSVVAVVVLAWVVVGGVGQSASKVGVTALSGILKEFNKYSFIQIWKGFGHD